MYQYVAVSVAVNMFEKMGIVTVVAVKNEFINTKNGKVRLS